MGLVNASREARSLGKTAERFPPGAFMRRSEQDAIDIEDANAQAMGVVGF
jgi:hypothetical protein